MFKNILFPVDVMDSGSSDASLPVVLKLVEKFNCELHLISVVPDFGAGIVAQYFSKEAEVKMMEEAEKALEKFVNDKIPEHINVKYVTAQGGIYERIIEAAHQVKADLIVMTAHRPELKDYLLGPNAAKVVRHSDISVLVVRD